MESRFERQLKKGALEMLVLGLVCAGPTYGYELLDSMARRSNGLFALKEGTLYPILYRLEDDGLIEAQWRTSGGRTAPKKYYTATPEGHAAYAVQRKAWRALADCVDGFDREEQL